MSQQLAPQKADSGTSCGRSAPVAPFLLRATGCCKGAAPRASVCASFHISALHGVVVRVFNSGVRSSTISWPCCLHGKKEGAGLRSVMLGWGNRGSAPGCSLVSAPTNWEVLGLGSERCTSKKSRVRVRNTCRRISCEFSWWGRS